MFGDEVFDTEKWPSPLGVLAEEFIRLLRDNEEVPRGTMREELKRGGLPGERPILTGARAKELFEQRLLARRLECLKTLEGNDDQQRFLGVALVEAGIRWRRGPLYGAKTGSSLFGVDVARLAGTVVTTLGAMSADEFTAAFLPPLVVRRARELGPDITALARERARLLSEEQKGAAAALYD